MKKILLVFAMCAAFGGCQDGVQPGDYVDEYGVNHGQGVRIGKTVWAPVNCGYHQTYYKYGKLYQWGRKFGQGYDGSLYDVDGKIVRDYSDAFIPEMVEGPVSLEVGQSKHNSRNFYCSSSRNCDWLDVPDDKLWNSGTEENPVKTKHDPCPEGWRVPTETEILELIQYYSPWTADKNGLFGHWFSGPEPYSEAAPRIFLPAAGLRVYDGHDHMNCNSYWRGNHGRYWSSNLTPHGKLGSRYHLMFGRDVVMSNDYSAPAWGYSVRCVQE